MSTVFSACTTRSRFYFSVALLKWDVMLSCLGKLNSNTTEKDQGNEKELATDSVSDCHTLPTTHSSSDGLYMVIYECLKSYDTNT